MERTKKVELQGKQYNVQFPNCGQIIDIEALKQSMTSGHYGEMVASGIKSMYYALDIVDAISFVKTCMPEVARQFNVKNYTELNPEEVEDIMTMYKQEIKPWIDETLNELKNASRGEEK
jgi:hypothetical protein